MKIKGTHIAILIVLIIVGWIVYISLAGSQHTVPGETTVSGSKGYGSVLEQMGMISPQQALQDYQRLSIYPPNSRPLTRENIDLLMPNRRYEQPLPLEKGSDIYYILTADKYRVIGDETITFVLIVMQGTNPDAKRIPISITKSVIKKGIDVKDARYAAELTLVKNSANDYTADFICAQSFENEKKSSTYWVDVSFTIENDVFNASLPFQYYPDNTIPAKFTGNFRDQVRDGSLYIDVELEVKRKGFYIIDANLFDNEIEPVAYTVEKIELQTGKQWVPLLFFGKVLLDTKAKPPFVLKDVRGYRFIEAATPDPEFMDREMMKPYDGQYKTRMNSLQGLSDKEFEDEMKRRRLEFLQQEGRDDIGVH